MTTTGDLRARSVKRWVAASAAGTVVFVAGLGVGRLTDSSSLLNPIEATPRLESSVADISSAPAPTASDLAIEAGGDGVSTEKLEAALHAVDPPATWFVAGTPDLSPAGSEAVGHIAAVLVANPFIPVEVEVRTYTEATPGENHGLSTLMANRLVAALIEGGVSSDRLVAVGLGGPSQPTAGRTTLLTFDTDNQALAHELAELDWSAIELTTADAVIDGGQRVLDAVAAALSRHPEASLTLFGYAFEQTSTASHDRSHTLLDAAADHLIGHNVDERRLSTVGLGEAPLGLRLETVVEFEVGAPAAIALSLRQIDGNISFEPHTAELTPVGVAMIPEIVTALSLDPTAIIEISVHTYTEADRQQNHDLSHRQGRAVVDALVVAGVEPQRLVVVGHGDPPQFARPDRDTYITFYVIS